MFFLTRWFLLNTSICMYTRNLQRRESNLPSCGFKSDPLPLRHPQSVRSYLLSFLEYFEQMRVDHHNIKTVLFKSQNQNFKFLIFKRISNARPKNHSKTFVIVVLL